jgi:menaquinone-specific isochorismate synthase
LVAENLISITLALPLSPDLLHSVALNHEYRYYANLEAQHVLLGVGTAMRITCAGNNRIQQIQTTVSNLLPRWTHLDPDNTGALPNYFLTVAFDASDNMNDMWQGLPNTMLEIPAVLFQQNTTNACVTFTCCENQSVINNEWFKNYVYRQTSIIDWLNLVTKAKHDIVSQILDKVVLARHIRIHTPRQINPIQISNLLTTRYPNCTQIIIHMNERTLVAASPEKLVAVHNKMVYCDAVAGTAPLLANPDWADSPKIQCEHAMVRNHLIDQLQQLCLDVTVSSQPEIFSLRFVQHLRSRLTARLKQNYTILDVLQFLHPTPSVGGTPTLSAMQWLKTNESISRGWYAGVTGWIDTAGNGDLSLLLRCALIHGNQADLFAGAGIVADSDPETELAETEFKLQTLLDVLQDV